MTSDIEQVRAQMRALYRDVSDRNFDGVTLDVDDWWRHPDVLGNLGQLLAAPFIQTFPPSLLGRRPAVTSSAP